MNSKVYTLPENELRSLQLVLLDMLVEVDNICKENNIRYCIIAGTLLGAVRHKGFIPWDDDIDIAMTRDEYKKFQEVCKTKLNTDTYFFQDNTTDPHYLWGWGRLRHLDSEFVRVGQEHLKMKTGIFLDIFPVDNVPDFPPMRGLFTAVCCLLRKILYSHVGKVSAKTRFLRIIYNILSLVPHEYVFKMLNKLQKYNKKNTKYARKLTFPTPKGRPYGYLKQWYTELDEIEFEGKVFPCIKEWDEYLTYKFGDYMTLPDEKNRHWHPVSKFRLPGKQ